MTKKVKRYSEEFKAEAVKAIENNGGNVSATARQLGLPMQTLANWQRNGKLIKVSSKVLSSTIQSLFQPLRKSSV